MDPITSITGISPTATPAGAAASSVSNPATAPAKPQPQLRIEQLQNRVVVSVIDSTTGQVVQQISSEVWLRVAQMIADSSTSTFCANG